MFVNWTIWTLELQFESKVVGIGCSNEPWICTSSHVCPLVKFWTFPSYSNICRLKKTPLQSSCLTYLQLTFFHSLMVNTSTLKNDSSVLHIFCIRDSAGEDTKQHEVNMLYHCFQNTREPITSPRPKLNPISALMIFQSISCTLPRGDNDNTCTSWHNPSLPS